MATCTKQKRQKGLKGGRKREKRSKGEPEKATHAWRNLGSQKGARLTPTGGHTDSGEAKHKNTHEARRPKSKGINWETSPMGEREKGEPEYASQKLENS